MATGRTTNRITFQCGCARYYRNHRDALACAKAGVECEECKADDASLPERVERVRLTHDAFERAANGQGGFEDTVVKTLWEALP